ncbi:hypothetical protein TNCV_2294291 [Trichonephila clavipes]|nr:hypothetical protein TNCV_2294291 [Trichonephila clavipes]
MGHDRATQKSLVGHRLSITGLNWGRSLRPKVSTSNEYHHTLTLAVIKLLRDRGERMELLQVLRSLIKNCNAGFKLNLIWCIPPTNQWETGTSLRSLLENRM